MQLCSSGRAADSSNISERRALATGSWIIKKSNEKVIIFIHGLLGSEKTWINSNGAYWPSITAADERFSEYSVYQFSYRSTPLSGNYNVLDAAAALSETLKIEKITTFRRIIFVCHSLGGVLIRYHLVKSAILLYTKDTRFEILLVASPTLGSKYANYLISVLSILGFKQAACLATTQSNEWLANLDRDFTDLKESGKVEIRGKELMEDDSLFRPAVVSSLSAAKYFANPVKVPGSDHFSIAKPGDQEAFQHRVFREFVEEGERLAASKKRFNLEAEDNPRRPRIVFSNVGFANAYDATGLDATGREVFYPECLVIWGILRNIGEMPAVNCRTKIHYMFRAPDGGLPDFPPIDCSEDTPSVAAPAEDFQTSRIELVGERFDEFVRGDLKIFFNIGVSYNDPVRPEAQLLTETTLEISSNGHTFGTDMRRRQILSITPCGERNYVT